MYIVQCTYIKWTLIFSLLILTIMYSFVLDFISTNIQYINTHRIDLRKDYSILVSLCKLETKG
jgi:hypothetical protein